MGQEVSADTCDNNDNKSDISNVHSIDKLYVLQDKVTKKYNVLIIGEIHDEVPNMYRKYLDDLTKHFNLVLVEDSYSQFNDNCRLFRCISFLNRDVNVAKNTLSKHLCTTMTGKNTCIIGNDNFRNTLYFLEISKNFNKGRFESIMLTLGNISNNIDKYTDFDKNKFRDNFTKSIMNRIDEVFNNFSDLTMNKCKYILNIDCPEPNKTYQEIYDNVSTIMEIFMENKSMELFSNKNELDNEKNIYMSELKKLHDITEETTGKGNLDPIFGQYIETRSKIVPILFDICRQVYNFYMNICIDKVFSNGLGINDMVESYGNTITDLLKRSSDIMIDGVESSLHLYIQRLVLSLVVRQDNYKLSRKILRPLLDLITHISINSEKYPNFYAIHSIQKEIQNNYNRIVVNDYDIKILKLHYDGWTKTFEKYMYHVIGWIDSYLNDIKLLRDYNDYYAEFKKIVETEHKDVSPKVLVLCGGYHAPYIAKLLKFAGFLINDNKTQELYTISKKDNPKQRDMGAIINFVEKEMTPMIPVNLGYIKGGASYWSYLIFALLILLIIVIVYILYYVLAELWLYGERNELLYST